MGKRVFVTKNWRILGQRLMIQSHCTEWEVPCLKNDLFSSRWNAVGFSLLEFALKKKKSRWYDLVVAEGDSDEQSEGKAILLPRERLNFHKSPLFSSCQVSFYPGSTHTCLKKKKISMMNVAYSLIMKHINIHTMWQVASWTFHNFYTNWAHASFSPGY